MGPRGSKTNQKSINMSLPQRGKKYPGLHCEKCYQHTERSDASHFFLTGETTVWSAFPQYKADMEMLESAAKGHKDD